MAEIKSLMATADSVAALDASWGSWEQAEASAHEAFMSRSPADRLAWLEDILRLRAAVVTAPTGV